MILLGQSVYMFLLAITGISADVQVVRSALFKKSANMAKVNASLVPNLETLYLENSSL